MAGHSKWSKVKRLKGALDAKRGKLFSRLAKEISVAARMGGGDPALNPRLRSAVLAARAQNMPNDNIERAVKKGTGELEGGNFEEVIYEGYGPGGIAILLDAATDNKNRTAADLRHIFNKNNGNLAASGAVAYLFQRNGQIRIPLAAVTEEQLLELAVEAGAEDVSAGEEHHTVLTPPDQLYQVAEALRQKQIEPEEQKLVFIPGLHITINEEDTATQVLRLCDALEECDDVQNLYANFDLSEDIIEKLSL